MSSKNVDRHYRYADERDYHFEVSQPEHQALEHQEKLEKTTSSGRGKRSGKPKSRINTKAHH